MRLLCHPPSLFLFFEAKRVRPVRKFSPISEPYRETPTECEQTAHCTTPLQALLVFHTPSPMR